MQSVQFPTQPQHGERFVAPYTAATYVFDSVKNSWIFDPLQASGGRITISVQQPPRPVGNDLWIDQDDYSLYAYDGREQAWVGITNQGITSSVFIGENPPIYNQVGALWYDSKTGDLKVKYEDSTSKQWVSITGNGFASTMAAENFDLQRTIANLSDRLHDLENENFFTL